MTCWDSINLTSEILYDLFVPDLSAQFMHTKTFLKSLFSDALRFITPECILVPYLSHYLQI